MKQYNNVWGVALILIGLFVAFFGNHMLNATIYIFVTLAVFCIGCMLFYNMFLQNSNKNWIQWTIVIGIFVGANMAGAALVKYRKWGITVLAAWGGIMLGLLITTTFVVGSNATYWAIVMGCCFGAAFLVLIAEKKIVMLLTSFAGAYAIVRGISLYAGGYPNET